MKTNKQITDEIHDLAKEYFKVGQKPYISILQPRRDLRETAAQQLMSWKNRMVNVSSISVSYHAIDGNPVDTARCYLMDKALEDNSKYALFIDEDTALPYNAVMNMLESSRKYPDAIITGIYYVKFGNVMVSVVDEENRWMIPDVTPNTGLIRNVVSTGLGCALIPLHLIKKIKEKFEDLPLFCIIPEGLWGEQDIAFMGEDTWFFNFVKKCGIEVISDTSVHCVHMELKTGKYTAHPDVDISNYITQIPITTPLTLKDMDRVGKDYIDRMCKPNYVEKEFDKNKGTYKPYDFKNIEEKERICDYWHHNLTGEPICSSIEKYYKDKDFSFVELGCQDAGLSDLVLQEFDKSDVIGIDIIEYPLVGDLINKEERFKFILGSSLDVYTQFKNESIDYLYIDTDPHKEDQLRKEIDLWIPKVKNNGIVAFHDYGHSFHPDVKMVIDEYVEKNKFELIHLDYFNVYFQKNNINI